MEVRVLFEQNEETIHELVNVDMPAPPAVGACILIADVTKKKCRLSSDVAFDVTHVEYVFTEDDAERDRLAYAQVWVKISTSDEGGLMPASGGRR